MKKTGKLTDFFSKIPKKPTGSDSDARKIPVPTCSGANTGNPGTKRETVFTSKIPVSSESDSDARKIPVPTCSGANTGNPGTKRETVFTSKIPVSSESDSDARKIPVPTCSGANTGNPGTKRETVFTSKIPVSSESESDQNTGNIPVAPVIRIKSGLPVIKRDAKKTGLNTTMNTTVDVTDDVMETSSSDDMEVELPKRRKRKQRKAKRYAERFSKKWLTITSFKGWLSKSTTQKANGDDLAYCNLCKVNLACHKTNLFTHLKSKTHQLTIENSRKQLTLPEVCSKQLTKEDKIKRAEIKLVGLLAVKNLPFSLMDDLVPIICDLFEECEIAGALTLKRTKAHAVLGKMGQHFAAEQADHIKKPGSFFSLIMDETTDRSTKKQCAFVEVHFNHETNETETQFFDMVEPSSGDAAGLFDALKESLHKKNIPLSNLVGFSSDTCNVMFGENNSVVALLKEQNPNIVAIKCSCHLIHLAASHACLKLPSCIEDLLRDVPAHFNRSTLRIDKFSEYQKFCGTELHKVLSKSNTRWLSAKQCVDRVLEQYDPLKKYFENDVLPKDPSETSQRIHKTLWNVYNRVYLEFMSYVLEVLTDFNILFQGETPLLYRLKSEVEKMFKTVCLCFLKRDYVRTTPMRETFAKNPSNFVPLEHVYLGVNAHTSIQELESDEKCEKKHLKLIRTTCLDFYVELALQLKQRFSFIYKEPVFKIIEILNPECAMSQEFPSLVPVFSTFPILNEAVKLRDAEKEWREHSLLDFKKLGLDKLHSADKYWKHLFSLKNFLGEPQFPNLKIVIGMLMVLPFSNASVERVFSSLNLIKTDHRTSLNNESLLNLLHTKHGLRQKGTLLKYEPPLSLLRGKNVYNN